MARKLKLRKLQKSILKPYQWLFNYGDRRNDAYPEKLRRSFEAIQAYNAGLDDSEQFQRRQLNPATVERR